MFLFEGGIILLIKKKSFLSIFLAFVMAIPSVTFAYGEEINEGTLLCICETACEENAVNEGCEACKEDVSLCTGAKEIHEDVPLCTCETACEENAVNERCKVCKKSFSLCTGIKEENEKVNTINSDEKDNVVYDRATGIVDSGFCGGEGDGTNLTWTLDSDGTLTISGTGKMMDYVPWDNDTPWHDNCTSITLVTMESGMTSIGKYAFYDCSGLTSVTIPDSVTSIESWAFYDCRGLTSITIPDSVVSIGVDVFGSCDKLKSAGSIGGGYNYEFGWTESIPGNAFNGCKSLTSVTIPDSVTSIGSHAFNGCRDLTSITIPDSVTSIGSHAFYDCGDLTSVTIPDSVTLIGEGAFSYCHSMTSAGPIGGGYNYEFGWTESIPSYAFSYSDLTSVTIPDSVTSIEGNAFSYSDLTSVTIPDSVASIGSHAFEGCRDLTSITIPDNVISIEEFTFSHCSSLTSVMLPDSITSIGERAFSYCSSLTSVTIPDSVISIGGHAFHYCDNLTSVTIPDSVTSIGNGAFEGCRELTSVTIPNSVITIGDSAFKDCSGLTSVTILDGVTQIEDWVFYGCSNLTSIMIPDSITSIGSNAFYDCSGLSTAGPSGGGYAYEFAWTESVPENAFYGCNGLTHVTIPDSVTSIGRHAFNGCINLNSVTIPDSVTSIEYSAFDDCSSLTDVYYSGSQEDWAKITIDFINECLTSANIHYNSTGPEDILDDVGSSNVSFLHDYDPATRIITFGSGEVVSPYTLSESADTSNIEQLLEKYVLVTMDKDNVLTVNSIEPVESYIGTVSAEEGHSLTIDGTNYPVKEDIALGIYLNQEVLYHVYNGTIVGINILEKKTGILEEWNNTNKMVTIDGTEYPTNYMTDLTFLANIDHQLLGTTVNYYIVDSQDYKPFLKIDIYKTITGTFSQYDVFDNVIFVDGEKYPVDSKSCSPDTNALNGKKVFFLLKNGKVTHIDTMDNVKGECVISSLANKIGSTTYDNGGFTVKTFPVKADVYYKLKLNYELPIGYDTEKILSEAGLGTLVLESMTWDNLSCFKFYGSEINGIKIEPGKTAQIEFTVSIADGYVPSKSETISGILSISGRNEKNGQTMSMQKSFSIDITKAGQESTEPDNPDKPGQEPTEPDNPDKPEDDDKMSEWHRKFLHQLYEIEDVDVTSDNGQYSLARYFDKETIEDIGRLVTYWTAVLKSEYAKKATDGDLSPYLKINCKMTENSNMGRYKGHKATLIFKYESKLNWTFAKFDNTNFILIDETTGAVLVENGLHSFSVSASAKTFANGIDLYLKKEFGDEINDFCKKLGTDAIKEMVKDTAIINGTEYLNTMLDIYEDIEAIAKNAQKFVKYTEKASKILRNPIKAAVSSAKEFNDVTAKCVTAQCPVDMYIYNSKGDLCGAIENETITFNTMETFMSVSNGEKSAWVNDDYTIKLVATDEGTMDYTIKEYKEGEESRTVFFDNVPLSKGITYSGNIPKPLNISSSDYALTDNTGKKVCASSDTLKHNSSSGGSGGGGGSYTSKYTIQTSSDIENGTIEISPKNVSKGAAVSITAIPDTGYELNSLTVTDKNGNEIKITDKGNGKYTFVMPSSNVTIEAEFWKIKEEFIEPDEVLNPFIDVNERDWFYEAVMKAYAEKLMNGVSANAFSPKSPITRGMVVTVLYNMEGRPEPKNTISFLDVAKGKYYEEAVAWASENKIVSGYNTQAFKPEENITREQFVSILYRYAGYKGYDITTAGELNKYSDADQISEYAVQAMKWAVVKGIVSGDNIGRLNPLGGTTRAEAASMIVRFYNDKLK